MFVILHEIGARIDNILTTINHMHLRSGILYYVVTSNCATNKAVTQFYNFFFIILIFTDDFSFFYIMIVCFLSSLIVLDIAF